MARPPPPIAPKTLRPVAARSRPRGRPPVISSEKLLEVAREVFLELGIRATTQEVAKRAGIAEGTIFHRFKSKEELFRSAMQFDPDEALGFVERLPTLAGKGDLRQTLIDFAEQFLRLARVAVPVMMMSWSNPESQMCGDRAAEKGDRHRRLVLAIRAFFDAEMRAGRLQQRNPEVLARMLLGSLHQYCMSELFTRDKHGLSLPDFASEVVDVLLAASIPSVPSTPRARARAALPKRRAREVL